MSRLVTASAKIECPVCNRTQLEFKRVVGKLTKVKGWYFFCPRCLASAELAQSEIDRADVCGGFYELLRERLVASMGRAAKLMGPEEEGPELRVVSDLPPGPAVKKRPVTKVPPSDSSKNEDTVRLRQKPISPYMRQLLKARRALNKAVQTGPTEDEA